MDVFSSVPFGAYLGLFGASLGFSFGFLESPDSLLVGATLVFWGEFLHLERFYHFGTTFRLWSQIQSFPRSAGAGKKVEKQGLILSRCCALSRISEEILKQKLAQNPVKTPSPNTIQFL